MASIKAKKIRVGDCFAAYCPICSKRTWQRCTRSRTVVCNECHTPRVVVGLNWTPNEEEMEFIREHYELDDPYRKEFEGRSGKSGGFVSAVADAVVVRINDGDTAINDLREKAKAYFHSLNKEEQATAAPVMQAFANILNGKPTT